MTARRIFGSSALAGDRARDVWIPRAFQGLGQDFRLAVRTLRATPVVTGVAVLSLALGIGANTAIFSLVNSLVLRSLPVREPEKLVLLSDTTSRGGQYWHVNVWEQIRQAPVFESAAAWFFTRFDMATGTEAQLVDGAWVSGSFFDALGVHAALGRTFSIEDDRPGGGTDGPVMVISHAFWQRGFGGTADVIGRRLPINGVPVSIVGVAPSNFFGLDVGRAVDIMMPLGDESVVRAGDRTLKTPSVNVMIFGRLKRGQRREEAVAALRAIQPSIREAELRNAAVASDPYLRDYLLDPFTLLPAATGFSSFRDRYVRPLVMILAAAALVLLVACANVANLLLARAQARRHEMSVRVAIGASRWRLIRSLIAESVILAIMAGGAGIWLASWSGRALVRQLSTQTSPVALDLSPDWRLLAFAILVGLATLLLFGVVPAVRASAVAPMDALRDRERGTAAGDARIGLGGSLVVAQVALSVVLVVAAGLFVRTFTSLMRLDPGFARHDVLLAALDGPGPVLGAAERMQDYARVRDAVRGVPGVTDAALSELTPVNNVAFDPPIDVSGGGPLSARERKVFANVISPGWFHTMGIPFVAGRDLTDDDRLGAPLVAVVNRAFAQRFLNGASPLDHTITLPAVMTTPARNLPIRIVGVVADAIYLSLRERPQPTMYLPIGQHDESFFVRALEHVILNVRSDGGSPARLAKSVTAAIASVDPRLKVTIRPLADQINDSLARERVIAMLAGFFGAARAIAGGPRALRRDVVRRVATTHGNRHPHGARRRTGRRRPPGVVQSRRAGGARCDPRRRRQPLGGDGWWRRSSTASSRAIPRRSSAPSLTLAAVGAFAGWLPARRASRIDPALALRAE